MTKQKQLIKMRMLMVFIQPLTEADKNTSFVKRHRRRTEVNKQSGSESVCVCVLLREEKQQFVCLYNSLPPPDEQVSVWTESEWFTAPSCLPVSTCTCCTGCLCSAACPTRWRWTRSSPRSSCGGSHGNGCQRRMGSGVAGSEGCRSHWEGARKKKKKRIKVCH